MRILGIDPGTGICGFGVIEIENGGARRVTSGGEAGVRLGMQAANSMRAGGKMRAVDFGVITTPARTPLPDRLLDIYNSLHEIIEANQPDVVSIEKLFFTKNITTGISVAEARGVVILVVRQAGLPIFEYTPNEIKKTITGYGSADKKQMQEMVRLELGLEKAPQPDDAADALAAAITHRLMGRG